MMLRSVLFVLFSFFVYRASSQQTVSLHVVTMSRNLLPGSSDFKFEINDKVYKLKAGECLDTELSADSIHIIVKDRRLVKQKTDEVHIAATGEMYIWVKLIWTGTFREPRYGAEVICKTCYEELKQKCKRTITD